MTDMFTRPGFGQPVTVYRAASPARDKWGTLLPGTTVVIERCAFAPQTSRSARSSSETAAENADTVTTTAALYCPPGADVQADDVVEVPDGTRWDVDGDPEPWTNPFTGVTAGVVVRLTQSRG